MRCYEMNVAAPMVQSGLGIAQQGEFGLGLDHLNPERLFSPPFNVNNRLRKYH